MVGAWLLGMTIGLSLIVAIGAQNAFVLRSGLTGTHVGPIVAVCAISDAVLIVAGVAGVGAVVERFPRAIDAVTVLGAAFLAVYGVMALRRARNPSAMSLDATATMSLTSAVGAALALTWLNPHVYLDTVVFLGSVANRETGTARWAFAWGAVTASLLWFTALGYGARLLRPVFTRPRAWQILDVGIGVLMLAIAASLAGTLL